MDTEKRQIKLSKLNKISEKIAKISTKAIEKSTGITINDEEKEVI